MKEHEFFEIMFLGGAIATIVGFVLILLNIGNLTYNGLISYGIVVIGWGLGWIYLKKKEVIKND